MIPPRTWLTLAFGAVAGAGVSLAALSLRRGPAPCEACFDDGGAAEALRLRAAAPTGGASYRVGDGHQSKERCLVDLPSDGERVVSFPIDGATQARLLPKEQVRRILFRDLDLFLASWKPVAPPVVETVGGRTLVRSTWGGPDDDGWARREVWVDAATKAFVRLLDRTRDGHPFHEVEVLPQGPRPFDPLRALFEVSLLSIPEPRLNARNVGRFEDFVQQVRLALYVPSRLPARMRRVDYAYEDRPLVRPRPGVRAEMPVVWVSYGDGVSLMNVVCAEPGDLDRLTEVSRGAAPKGMGSLARDMACASLPADTPEDLIGGDGQIRVRRRTNGCLTVLRRDGLPGGVSVVLVCQGGMPADVPLETIRTLVRLQTRDRAPADPTADEGSLGSPDARPLPDAVAPPR